MSTQYATGYISINKAANDKLYTAQDLYFFKTADNSPNIAPDAPIVLCSEQANVVNAWTLSVPTYQLGGIYWTCKQLVYDNFGFYDAFENFEENPGDKSKGLLYLSDGKGKITNVELSNTDGHLYITRDTEAEYDIKDEQGQQMSISKANIDNNGILKFEFNSNLLSGADVRWSEVVLHSELNETKRAIKSITYKYHASRYGANSKSQIITETYANIPAWEDNIPSVYGQEISEGTNIYKLRYLWVCPIYTYVDNQQDDWENNKTQLIEERANLSNTLEGIWTFLSSDKKDNSSTVINGGYIKTHTLNADAIWGGTLGLGGGSYGNGDLTVYSANNELLARLGKEDTINSVKYPDGIYAISGKIGGWNLTANSLYTGSKEITDNSPGSFGLSTSDFSRIVCGNTVTNLRLAIGKNFGVTNDGTLYANNAKITGSLKLGGSNNTNGTLEVYNTSGTSIATITNTGIWSSACSFNGGSIGGFNIDGNSLYTSTFKIANTGFSGSVAGYDINNFYMKVGNNFGVNADGNIYCNQLYSRYTQIYSGELTANNATITGTIRATDGYLTNVTIYGSCDVQTSFAAKVLEAGTISANKITAGTLNLSSGIAISSNNNLLAIDSTSIKFKSSSSSLPNTILSTSGFLCSWQKISVSTTSKLIVPWAYAIGPLVFLKTQFKTTSSFKSFTAGSWVTIGTISLKPPGMLWQCCCYGSSITTWRIETNGTVSFKINKSRSITAGKTVSCIFTYMSSDVSTQLAYTLGSDTGSDDDDDE